MMNALEHRLFPCPLCGELREVRRSIRAKPYITCNNCCQLFIRTAEGTKRLLELVEKAEKRNVWERFKSMEERYRKQCPKCGQRFWISEELIQTSWLDGSFIGYRCPECGETVKPEVRE